MKRRASFKYIITTIPPFYYSDSILIIVIFLLLVLISLFDDCGLHRAHVVVRLGRFGDLQLFKLAHDLLLVVEDLRLFDDLPGDLEKGRDVSFIFRGEVWGGGGGGGGSVSCSCSETKGRSIYHTHSGPRATC